MSPEARLTDLLWGDRGEDQAKASLRQALYELRDLAHRGPDYRQPRARSQSGPKRLWTDVGEVEAATEPCAFADALEEVQWPPLGDLDDITPGA